MASVIEAVEIRCPHCGASLYRTGLRPGAHRLCPFCGTSFVTGAANMSETEVRISCKLLPFRTDRKDFEREVLKRLARDNKTPGELFNTLYFINVEGIYYPVYAYGSDGHGKGRRAIYPAVESGPLTEEISGYIAGEGYGLSGAEACSQGILDRRTFLTATLDKEECLKRYAPDVNDGTPPHDIRSGKAELFLVPFWVMTFKYGEHVYRFVMDGTDSSKMTESMPRMPEKEKPNGILRQISGVLQVLSWLSLITLFWNIYWIPMTLWTLWVVSALALQVQGIIGRRRAK